MSDPREAFQKFLAQQRADYGLALPAKVAEIDTGWQAALKSGEPAPPALAELERMAHTLAGTAGTLGFVEAGRAAGELEELLERAAAGGVIDGPAQWAGITSAVQALRAAAAPDGAADQTTHTKET
jgi:periplasmic divalent cation tolerance protein